MADFLCFPCAVWTTWGLSLKDHTRESRSNKGIGGHFPTILGKMQTLLLVFKKKKAQSHCLSQWGGEAWNFSYWLNDQNTMAYSPSDLAAFSTKRNEPDLKQGEVD